MSSTMECFIIHVIYIYNSVFNGTATDATTVTESVVLKQQRKHSACSHYWRTAASVSMTAVTGDVFVRMQNCH